MTPCQLAPAGWFCSLEAGHTGSCPTWPESGGAPLSVDSAKLHLEIAVLKGRVTALEDMLGITDAIDALQAVEAATAEQP